MKNVILLCIVSLFVFALSGCTTVQTDATQTPVTATAQTIASIVQPIAQGAVPLVLNKNPLYAPAIKVVADAIPSAFGTSNLTAESITETIALLNTKAELNLSADAQSLISTALSISVQQYQQRFGAKVAAATDKNVQLILTAFAQGLSDGCTIWQSSHKGS